MIKQKSKKYIFQKNNRLLYGRSPNINRDSNLCHWNLEALKNARVWAIPLIEGCYTIGVEKGLYTSFNSFFRVLSSNGCLYCASSYFKYRRKQFSYIPFEAIVMMLHLSGCTIQEAIEAGQDRAKAIFDKYG